MQTNCILKCTDFNSSLHILFCRRYAKNILVCFFWFTVLTAVHLQNANAKFHKVG